MSFILDALKKSETERQEQGAAEFSRVPTSSGAPNPARWLWLLAALLLVNFAVLLVVLLQPDREAAVPAGEPPAAVTPAATIAPPPATTTGAGSSFAEQVASVAREQPVTAEQGPAAGAAPEPPAPGSDTAPSPPANTAPRPLPTLEELRLSGAINVAELHLDIHVYSADPAARFVFINMNKYREGSRTAEGPVVREITANGAILDYQGREFLLSRQ